MKRPAQFFKIGFKCPKTWGSLSGRGTLRDCDDCKTTVVDITSDTEDALDAVLESDGHLCVRARVRPDRAVVASPRIAAALAAMLVGQEVSAADSETTDPCEQTSSGMIFEINDSTGLPLPGVLVTVQTNGGEVIGEGITNTAGRHCFNLPQSMDLRWQTSRRGFTSTSGRVETTIESDRLVLVSMDSIHSEEIWMGIIESPRARRQRVRRIRQTERREGRNSSDPDDKTLGTLENED